MIGIVLERVAASARVMIGVGLTVASSASGQNHEK